MLDITTAYGLVLRYPVADLTIGRCLAWYGEFGRVGLDWLQDTLETLGEGGEYLDLGCNIGALSLPVAARRPDWRVVGVEAHRGLANLYAANAIGNGLGNVEPVHAAVGRAPGLVAFPSPPLDETRNFGTLGVGAPAARTEPVRLTTVDELASPRTRLIKVDVEGYEPEVLAGAAHTLEALRPVWLLEASKAHLDASRSVMRTLLAAGYSLHWLYVPFVVVDSLKANPTKGPIGLGDFNIVALPPGAANVWNLAALAGAEDPWPGTLAELPYLKRYGY